MKQFAHHAARCGTCAEPYDVFRRGGTLCPLGHQLAIDVAQYVYGKGGQAYSQVDREGHQRVQIEIPPQCEVVRSLLRAIERGLRLRERTPAVSYDRTYMVAARPPIIHQRAPAQGRTPRLERAEPRVGVVAHPRRSRTMHVAGKGSLYAEELAERERYYTPPVYYRIAPAGPAGPPTDRHRV